MDFYEYLKNASKLEFLDKAVRLHFNLFLAVMLDHDHAHAVDM